MHTSKVVLGLLLGAASLAGCGGAPTVVEADAVIAGKRYVDQPVVLGAVKMWLKVREGAAPADETKGPENLELSLGFLAKHEDAKVILSSATLSYGEGKTAEISTRHAAKGTDKGCEMERGAGLTLDYWFNATVNDEFWNCVTIALVTPGRMKTDVLELKMEPINVNGEQVRTLPITFVVRPPAE